MKKNLKNVLWVLFILCFIPYVYLACVSIFGANTGFFESSWEYGWETVIFAAVVLCMIPVIPICLIYQAVYAVFVLRGASKKRKKIAAILFVTLLVLIAVPASLHELSAKLKTERFRKKNYPKVEAYMRTRLSPELAEGAKLYRTLRDDRSLQIYVPCEFVNSQSGKKEMLITYHIDENGAVTDNMPIYFGDANNKPFYNELCAYIASEHNLPDHWSVGAELLDLSLLDYHPGDSAEKVFSTCQYKLRGIYMDEPFYDMQRVLDAVALYRAQYAGGFEKDDPNFYVRVNDKYIASVQIIDTDTGYTLRVSGYVEPSGITIPDSTWEVTE